MQDAKAHSQHFFCFQQMPDIAAGIVPAGRAFAAFFDRTIIQLILCVKKIDLSMVSINVSMTTVPAWIHAVKEIDASFNSLHGYLIVADNLYLRPQC